jgi:hypothetical protein
MFEIMKSGFRRRRIYSYEKLPANMEFSWVGYAWVGCFIALGALTALFGWAGLLHPAAGVLSVTAYWNIVIVGSGLIVIGVAIIFVIRHHAIKK